MIAYEGQKCLFCEKEMQKNEDIAVCPECGTPYHRACYLENGHCVNTALHETGGSWQVQQEKIAAEKKREEKRAEEAEQAAARERGDVPPMFQGGLYDGVRIDPAAPCAGLDPSEEMDGVTMGELSEFVRTNCFYYLPLFRLMKRTGKRISFNTTSLFFPELFFANRKMWAMTMVSIFFKVLFTLPNYLVLAVQELGLELAWLDLENSVFQGLFHASAYGSLIFSVICSLFANYLYYRHAVRKIRELKKKAPSETAFHSGMKLVGGTKLSNIAIVFVVEMAVWSIVLFVIQNI